MAISFVGSLPAVGANNGGNVTLTFSNLVNAAGGSASLQQDDVVVCAYMSSGIADAACSTSSSNWNELTETYANGTSNDTNLAVYWKKMGASPDTSFVAVGPTGNNNATVGVAFAFRGCDTTNPIDVFTAGSHAVTGTGTGRPDPAAIQPVTAGAWIVVVGAAAAATGATFTNPGDLSSTTNHFRALSHAETIDGMIGMGIKTDWSSGSFNPAQWTSGPNNAGDSWSAFSIALKPAPAVATGSLSTTEAADTASLAGDVLVQGSIGATEGADTLAIAGDVIVQGSLAASESGSDTASLAGDVIVQGSLSVSESGADTFTAAGTVQDSGITGTLAATEAADTASLAGDVFVQGSLAATEGADSAALAGDVLVHGTLAGTEGSDTASLAGDVLVQGQLAANEGVDTAALSGDVLVRGALAASEGNDTLLFLGGNVPITGLLAANENADTASLAGQVIIDGTLAPSEAADTGSIVGRILISGSINATEAANDTFSASGLPAAPPPPESRTTYAPARAGMTGTDDMGNSASAARSRTISAPRMRA